MNSTETIKYQGIINSGSCYPKRLEEINQDLPFFEILKDQNNRYDIKFYNYEKEDNAPRVPYLQSYFKNSILSNIEKSIDLKGFYNIELHDSYTYRNNNFS